MPTYISNYEQRGVVALSHRELRAPTVLNSKAPTSCHPIRKAEVHDCCVGALYLCPPEIYGRIIFSSTLLLQVLQLQKDWLVLVLPSQRLRCQDCKGQWEETSYFRENVLVSENLWQALSIKATLDFVIYCLKVLWCLQKDYKITASSVPPLVG